MRGILGAVACRTGEERGRALRGARYEMGTVGGEHWMGEAGGESELEAVGGSSNVLGMGEELGGRSGARCSCPAPRAGCSRTTGVHLTDCDRQTART